LVKSEGKDIGLQTILFQIHTLKNAGLFQPNFGSKMDEFKHWVTILGQKWTNSNIGLKIEFKNVTQLLGFPTIELKQPSIFRVHAVLLKFLFIKES